MIIPKGRIELYGIEHFGCNLLKNPSRSLFRAMANETWDIPSRVVNRTLKVAFKVSRKINNTMTEYFLCCLITMFLNSIEMSLVW